MQKKGEMRKHSHVRVAILLIIILVIAAAIIAGLYFLKKPSLTECSSNSDCVPEQTCHPTQCVLSSQIPSEKSMLFCSQECKPNTLDCGQAECVCSTNKKCQTKFK
jgi:hypothetical protein